MCGDVEKWFERNRVERLATPVWRQDASRSYRRAHLRIIQCDDLDTQITVFGDTDHGELTLR
jgi:hypothetical protein